MRLRSNSNNCCRKVDETEPKGSVFTWHGLQLAHEIVQLIPMRLAANAQWKTLANDALEQRGER
jgi:hypothetical protein